jgi:hypothetical protein
MKISYEPLKVWSEILILFLPGLNIKIDSKSVHIQKIRNNATQLRGISHKQNALQ